MVGNNFGRISFKEEQLSEAYSCSLKHQYKNFVSKKYFWTKKTVKNVKLIGNLWLDEIPYVWNNV